MFDLQKGKKKHEELGHFLIHFLGRVNLSFGNKVILWTCRHKLHKLKRLWSGFYNVTSVEIFPIYTFFLTPQALQLMQTADNNTQNIQ